VPIVAPSARRAAHRGDAPRDVYRGLRAICARCRSSAYPPRREVIREGEGRGESASGTRKSRLRVIRESQLSFNDIPPEPFRAACYLAIRLGRPRPVALSSSTYADRFAYINPATRGRALPASREKSVKSCGKRRELREPGPHVLADVIALD